MSDAVERLQRLLDEATPGPWEAWGTADVEWWDVLGPYAVTVDGEGWMSKANAELVAKTPLLAKNVIALARAGRQWVSETGPGMRVTTAGGRDRMRDALAAFEREIGGGDD